MLEFPQLKERDYWTDVNHPELEANITYPGAFALFGEGSCEIRRRAPLIGEHNNEVYINELGLTRKELNSLKKSGCI